MKNLVPCTGIILAFHAFIKLILHNIIIYKIKQQFNTHVNSIQPQTDGNKHLFSNRQSILCNRNTDNNWVKTILEGRKVADLKSNTNPIYSY